MIWRSLGICEIWGGIINNKSWRVLTLIRLLSFLGYECDHLFESVWIFVWILWNDWLNLVWVVWVIDCGCLFIRHEFPLLILEHLQLLLTGNKDWFIRITTWFGTTFLDYFFCYAADVIRNQIWVVTNVTNISFSESSIRLLKNINVIVLDCLHFPTSFGLWINYII